MSGAAKGRNRVKYADARFEAADASAAASARFFAEGEKFRAANPKVKQRLDTGMFFIAFDNGDIYKGDNGEKFFADIRDAYTAKEQILAQRDQEKEEKI